MTSSTVMLMLALAVSVLTLATCSSSGGNGLRYDHYVQINNTLDHKQTVTVRCTDDKQRVVGEKQIVYGDILRFTLHTSLTTYYYCTFDFLPNALHQPRVFRPYLKRRERDRCSTGNNNCLWYLRESGPCFLDTECYTWDPYY